MLDLKLLSYDIQFKKMVTFSLEKRDLKEHEGGISILEIQYERGIRLTEENCVLLQKPEVRK